MRSALVVFAAALVESGAAAQMGAIPDTGTPPNTIPRGANRTGAAGGATMGAIPGTGAANRGDATSGATMGAIPGTGAANRVPGNAGIPGTRRTRRGAQPAGVTYPVVLPSGQAVPDEADDREEGGRDPEGQAPTVDSERRVRGGERVDLPAEIPRVNAPDVRSRFREVAARRQIIAARAALRDALASNDPSKVAQARRGLERARAALRQASDEDEQRAAWLEALEERRARIAGARGNAEEWERLREMQRRERWARLRAERAESEPLSDAARNELRAHALRMAKLRRVRDLASRAGDQAVVDRVDEVADVEVARHAAAMRQLALAGNLEEGL